jgi:acetylglutamate kinase
MREFYQVKYRDSLFVVKAGGRVIQDEKSRMSLLEDIKDLTDAGIRILLIYGGGHAIDAALQEADIEPRKVNGRRITGPREMQLIKRVMAADLGYKIGGSMAQIGLYGLTLGHIPPSWVKVTPRERENAEDYGYDGTIEAVDAEGLRRAFEKVPFIATPCLSVTDKDGININADNVAVGLAAGCKARKLILLSDVDGVRLQDGSTAPYITDAEIPGLIEDGTVHGGMRVKLENCLYALQEGVKRIHLLDGFREHALASEIYESIGPATMIIRDEDRQAYLNEVEAQKVIQRALEEQM